VGVVDEAVDGRGGHDVVAESLPSAGEREWRSRKQVARWGTSGVSQETAMVAEARRLRSPAQGRGAEVLSLVERGLYQGFRPGEPGLEDLPLQHRSVRGDPHETVRRVHPQELLGGGFAE